MRKFLFLLSLCLATLANAQSDVQITPGQLGAFGAAAGDIPTVTSPTSGGHTHITRAALATAITPSITLAGDVTGAANSNTIANNAVTTVKIANDAVTTAKIPDGAVTMPKIAQAGAASGQVIKWNGTSWAPGSDDGSTYTAGTGISISGLTISNSGDLSATNELQTLATATNTVTLSNGGGSFTVAGAGVNTVTTSGTTITITGTEVDGSTTNELQTIATATNTVTLSNGGGSFTVAGAGINTVTTSGSTITVTGTEVDGSTTNEIQTVSRNVATNNVVTLSLSGGTVNVEDLFVEATATFTAGQTTATMSGTLPSENAKLWVFRNGIRHVVGASGCSGCNVVRSGSTLTFASSLNSGEVVTFKYPFQ